MTTTAEHLMRIDGDYSVAPIQPVIPAANKPGTLADVFEQVSRHQASYRETRCPLGQIQVANGRLKASDAEFTLNEDGLKSLCAAVDAPFGYLQNLPVDLSDRNLKFSLQQAGRRATGITDRNSMVRSRNGVFTGFSRADLCTLPGPVVLEALQEGLGDYATELHVQRLFLTDESFSLDIVSDRLRKEVRKGDILRAGIHLSHSSSGDEATQVMPFVVRLMCSNGMTHRECLGSRRTKRTRRLDGDRADAPRLQYEQIRDLVAETREKLLGKLDVIEGLQGERFDSPGEVVRTLEQFLRRGRMYSANLMALLRQAWVNPLGGDNEATYFGVLNALTWLATHPAELHRRNGSVYRVTDLQRSALSRLAGIFANQRVHICPSCFNVLPN